MKKTIVFLIILAFSAAFTLSCGSELTDGKDSDSTAKSETGETENTDGSENKMDYVIIYPENTDRTIYNAAHELADAIFSATGESVNVIPDSMTTPDGYHEITVGAAGRELASETMEGIKKFQYKVIETDGNIAIAGGNRWSIVFGVEHFKKYFLGYNEKKDKYGYDRITVDSGYSFSAFYTNADENGTMIYPDRTVAFKEDSYVQSIPGREQEGDVLILQANSYYSDTYLVDAESVLLSPSIYFDLETVFKRWGSSGKYKLGLFMSPTRCWSEDYLTNPYNFRNVQKDANGEYGYHSNGIYLMIPNDEWLEYFWGRLKDAIEKTSAQSVTFEEPEISDRFGYSDAFKKEWLDYYGTEWEDPASSAEASYKAAYLRVYLCERMLVRLYTKIKAEWPEMTVILATHTTINYNAWGIVSGAQAYVSAGCADAVIAQVWSDTAASAFPYNGNSKQVTFVNAYLEYVSMTDNCEGYPLYALSDPMSDVLTYTEQEDFKRYRQTIAATLMTADITRFEIMPWPRRAYTTVSDDYRTIQNNVFKALRLTDGQDITLSAGTSGITFLISDTLSWMENINGSMYRTTNDSFYGIAAPIVNAGIPLEMKAMDMLESGDDLDGTSLLMVSYDCMLPVSAFANASIAEWVKDGGTLMYVGGYNRLFETEGDPLKELFENLDLNITISRTEDSAVLKNESSSDVLNVFDGIGLTYDNGINYALSLSGDGVQTLVSAAENAVVVSVEAGEGRLILCTLPSAFFSSYYKGAAMMRALTEYSLGFTDKEYVAQSLMSAKRGDIIALHGLNANSVYEGSYIDIFDAALSVVTDPVVSSSDSRLLYDYSSLDLSVPRLAYTGAEVSELNESADRTSFKISGSENTTFSVRLIAPSGTYPSRVYASRNSKESEIEYEWENSTSSLLIRCHGYAGGVNVEIEWGSESCPDSEKYAVISETIYTRTGGNDSSFLVSNDGSENNSYRYAAEGEYIVYRFDITGEAMSRFSLTVKNNYCIEVSEDGQIWNKAADYTQGGTVEPISGGKNEDAVIICPFDYGISDSLYIRITASPDSGTDGAIMWIMRSCLMPK